MPGSVGRITGRWQSAASCVHRAHRPDLLAYGNRPSQLEGSVMNKLGRTLMLAAPLPPAVGRADKPSTGDKAVIDCAKQPSQTINTGDNTLTYIGTCERIVINGGENRLTIENVKQL